MLDDGGVGSAGVGGGGRAALAAVGYGSGINASDDESEWGDIQIGEDIITNKSYADYGSLVRKVRRLAC